MGPRQELAKSSRACTRTRLPQDTMVAIARPGTKCLAPRGTATGWSSEIFIFFWVPHTPIYPRKCHFLLNLNWYFPHTPHPRQCLLLNQDACSRAQVGPGPKLSGPQPKRGNFTRNPEGCRDTERRAATRRLYSSVRTPHASSMLGEKGRTKKTRSRI